MIKVLTYVPFPFRISFYMIPAKTYIRDVATPATISAARIRHIIRVKITARLFFDIFYLQVIISYLF